MIYSNKSEMNNKFEPIETIIESKISNSNFKLESGCKMNSI